MFFTKISDAKIQSKIAFSSIVVLPSNFKGLHALLNCANGLYKLQNINIGVLLVSVGYILVFLIGEI